MYTKTFAYRGKIKSNLWSYFEHLSFQIIDNFYIITFQLYAMKLHVFQQNYFN